MKLKAIIEIPTGSKYKYEIKDGILTLDRVSNQKIPCNYGYLENTLADDSDALDLFIISSQPLEVGSRVEVTLLGGFKCSDNGISDDKLVGMLVGEENVYPRIDLIKSYLETYKKDFRVLGNLTADEAFETYTDTSSKYYYNLDRNKS